MIIERDKLPRAAIVEHLESAWTAGNPAGVRDAQMYVPADGRVEVIWSEYGIVVGGHVTRPVVVEPSWKGPIHGVQMQLGRAGELLGADASDLVSGQLWLSDLWGAEADLLAERVAAQDTPAAAVGELICGLDRRAPELSPDPVIAHVAASVRDPRASVRAIADDVGYSERQLRRRFQCAAGFGPKLLQRIERFQRFIASRDDDIARVAADLGYSDESHLGRDARELAGASPATLLAQRG